VNLRRAIRRPVARWSAPAFGLIARKAGRRLAAVGAVVATFGLAGHRSCAASFTTLSADMPRTHIVIVEDPYATDAFKPRPDRIESMINRGMTNLTAKPTPREAWLSLVTTQDTVGIKVYSNPGPNSGTRPAVAAAVAQGLIAAGLPPTNIVIWDRVESDLRAAGFFELEQQLGIRVAASARAGYDETNFYKTSLIGNLVYGDLEFGKEGEDIGKRSFVSKLVTRELTKIINLTPLLNHNEAGVCGNLYSLALGSVDNTLRFESDARRLATAVPEIYALPAIYDRAVLNIVDALVCQYEGGQRGLLHYSTVLDQLRFSRDPVALDMLSVKELDRQRRHARAPNVRPNLELYRNAALLELGMSELSKMQIETLR
jgi:hypothetical protein